MTEIDLSGPGRPGTIVDVEAGDYIKYDEYVEPRLVTDISDLLSDNSPRYIRFESGGSPFAADYKVMIYRPDEISPVWEFNPNSFAATQRCTDALIALRHVADLDRGGNIIKSSWFRQTVEAEWDLMKKLMKSAGFE